MLELRKQYPTAKVAICLEQPAVNLILFLEPYSWITLYAINPLTLQKYREAFVISRAKDDGKDAEYLAELLLNHFDKLTVWRPEHGETRRLRQLVLHRRAVVDERTGLSNRLKALLKQYFPQAVELCGEELWRPLATDFLLKWPTLQKVQKTRAETLKKFYYLHGSRSQNLIKKRLALIEAAVPLTDEAELLETYTLRIQLICRQLQLVQKTLRDYERQIAKVFSLHPDREIFDTLPGAGPTFAPRLLAAMGSDRDRFGKASCLQRYTGIAPVTKQSGGKRHVHRRYLCPKFLKQTFHEFAKESVLHSRWSAAFYLQQRNKGCGYNTAVRALAYKWQRIIWKCWQTQTAYQEHIYEEALRKNKSALVGLFDQVELGKSPFKTKCIKN